MTEHILEAYKEDIYVRTHGLEQLDTAGLKVNAREIKPGVVYKDQNITVKAFLVKHGTWREAFGYRFETPDRSIVISGDTSPSESIIENCNGCDVLIHEAYTVESFNTIEEESRKKWQEYHKKYHTSSIELAEIATKAKPGLLILYHRENPGRGSGATEEQILKEIQGAYKGRVVSARDLDIY